MERLLQELANTRIDDIKRINEILSKIKEITKEELKDENN